MSYFSGHPDQKFGNVFYSQHGEDIIVLNIFDKLQIEKPSYLDLGAHHPSRISNTKLLYERGSRGVNVEPNPHLIEEFRKQRPDDVNLPFGVNALSFGSSREEFYMYDDWSGRNTFSIEEYRRVSEEFGMKMTQCRTMDCLSVNDIVRNYCNNKWPDFLNCDLESMDFDILYAADFSKSKPKVICVETSDKFLEFKHLLLPLDYEIAGRMGDNTIFLDMKA